MTQLSPEQSDLSHNNSDPRSQNGKAGAKRPGATKTVNSTRESLTSTSGHSKEFDYEIILSNARNHRAAMFVIVGIVLFTGIMMLTWMNYFMAMIWISVNLAIQGHFSYQARHFIQKKPKDRKTLEKWRRKFVCLNLLSGLIWACMLLIPVTTPSLSQPVFAFTTLLIVIAIYCFISAPLSAGMLSATVPITLTFVVVFSLTGYTSLIMMAGLFVVAQLLFIFMARQIRANLLKMLTVRAEKDSLILELEEATATSDEARRHSEEANLAKSRFLATMSHELRTPLNAILGFSEIMQQELLGPLSNDSYKEYIADIHASGDHLLNLINEILDLSRIEAGRYELYEEPVVLLDIVEDCQGLIQIRATNKQISIEVNSEEDMPRLWADQKAIRQIVLNLLSNAVKFTPQGGHIDVHVGWTAGGGQYVRVEDNGPGIPEEEIPVVLSQFGQGSSAIKSAEQGTGLGLPICQALVNMHGGAFDLRSKLRVGTKVTITFPKTRVMSALAREETDSHAFLKPAGQRVMTRRSA